MKAIPMNALDTPLEVGHGLLPAMRRAAIYCLRLGFGTLLFGGVLILFSMGMAIARLVTPRNAAL